MSKHTPPPWTLKTIPGFEQGRPCIYGEDPVLPIAALLNGYLPERSADAALLIAAPELLEALREIAKGEGPYSRDPLEHASDTIEAMKEMARAAIAKAEPVTQEEETDAAPPVTYCDYCGRPNPCNKAGCRAAHSAGM